MIGVRRYIQAFAAAAAGDLRPGEEFQVRRCEHEVMVVVRLEGAQAMTQRTWVEGVSVLDAHPRADTMGTERAAIMLNDVRREIL